jgi:hypothetical protein
MNRTIFTPARWDQQRGPYAVGWKDAEFGLPLGAGGALYRGEAKLAYEAGYADFWKVNPQAGGGV